jgi:hypothetical protein
VSYKIKLIIHIQKIKPGTVMVPGSSQTDSTGN